MPFKNSFISYFTKIKISKIICINENENLPNHLENINKNNSRNDKNEDDVIIKKTLETFNGKIIDIIDLTK